MTIGAFLGHLLSVIIICIISFLSGFDAIANYRTIRKDHVLDFENRKLRAQVKIRKEFSDYQTRYIKQLEQKNDKLKKTNSKKSN